MFLNRTTTLILLTSLLNSYLIAGTPYGGRKSNTNSSNNGELLYLSEKNHNTENVLIKSFELNIDPNSAKDTIVSRSRYQKTMRGTYSMVYATEPIRLPFKLINTIYVNSTYQTTLIFPQEYTLQTPAFSEKFKSRPIVSANILSFKVDSDFLQGNIVVPMHSEDGNTLVTIYLEKYLPYDDIQSKKDQGIYTAFSSVIEFVKVPKTTNIEVLDAYLDSKGEGSIFKTFREDGDFDTIVLYGVTFFIIRDDKEGVIEVNHTNFRISNRFEAI